MSLEGMGIVTSNYLKSAQSNGIITIDHNAEHIVNKLQITAREKQDGLSRTTQPLMSIR
jgi:hypothetical protein